MIALDPVERLSRPADAGRLIAEGRKRLKLSQAALAERLGINRKTVSLIERGKAENISLATALKALAMVGKVVTVSTRRPPTINEIMERRAAEEGRIATLSNARIRQIEP